MARRGVQKRTRRTHLQEQQVAAENLRYTLPVGQYLHILHVAATTGKVPVLDSNGRADTQAEWGTITPKEQVDTAKYMMDKVIPNRAPTSEELGHDSDVDTIDVSSESFDRLTDRDLMKIADMDDNEDILDYDESDYD